MTTPQSATNPVAVHVYVSGLVQGVGYRAALADEAERLMLSGWCRNLPDGRVETWLEGPNDAVTQMLGWLHCGPKHARVDHVEEQWQVPVEHVEKQPIRFEIRR